LCARHRIQQGHIRWGARGDGELPLRFLEAQKET
jgi:hypothetical protein